MPNTPEIRQLRKLIGSEKSKKPLMKLAIIRSRNPETAFIRILNTSFTGAASSFMTTTTDSTSAIAVKIRDAVSIFIP